jgi:hypothetical protein
MTDRNLYIRASEGDEEAEREVLARLRRKHGRDLANEAARAVLPMALHEYHYGEYGRAERVLEDLAGTLQAMRGDPFTGRYPAGSCTLIAWVLACARECRDASLRESSTIDGRSIVEAFADFGRAAADFGRAGSQAVARGLVRRDDRVVGISTAAAWERDVSRERAEFQRDSESAQRCPAPCEGG